MAKFREKEKEEKNLQKYFYALRRARKIGKAKIN